MGNEPLILGIMVLIVFFVFVLPMVLKKRNEGFTSTGITAYDILANDRDSYVALRQKKYNTFSDSQDVTKPNFANVSTQPAIDQASKQVKDALRTSLLDVDPTSKTLLGINPDTPPQTLAPVNQIVEQAKRCELLNSRDNCMNLKDPYYSNCGVCVRDRETMFPQTNDKFKHGGLLILPDDKKDAELSHSGKEGPVIYQPTVGSCPPGYFFTDYDACVAKSNQLDCEEAGQNGGWNKGKTSEGVEVIDKKCANAPVAGSDIFVYDTKTRRFDVNLRVITPIGTGITKVYVTDKASGQQLGYGMTDTPGKAFVITVKNVTEAQAVNVLVEQEAPYRNRNAKSEVFLYNFNADSPPTVYNQTIASAAAICKRIGTRQATKAELEQAWSNGLQVCACGQTTEGSMYPMQATHHSGFCGNNTINICGNDPNGWNKGLGYSWCYGVKPPKSINFQTIFSEISNWFHTMGKDSSPSQADKPSVWSKWGPDYQAPSYRAVIMQWEHTEDPKRMAQSFEPSIVAINDQAPSSVNSEGLKTFTILRRFGTYANSSLILAPRPVSGAPMITNQFWIWANLSNSATVKFTAQIPGTFLLPLYKDDGAVVRRGQLIAKQSTNTLLQISPCLKDGQVAGKYSMACLSNLFYGSGGIAEGKLNKLGMVDPYNGTGGNGLADLNKLGDMDAISNWLSNQFTIATTGRDATGMPVGGSSGQIRAKTINKAAQWMFGFDITSPCEDVEQDAAGNIIIVPRTGALDSFCLQYLWLNAGTDKVRGSEDPSRFTAPRRGGISATYTTIGDRYSGLRSTEGNAKMRADSPFQTCQPTGSMSPIDASGRVNAKNVSMANALGGIKAVQNFYDSLMKTANYGGKNEDKQSMTTHATAVEQCFGPQKTVDSKVATGCGVVCRYVYILPTAFYEASRGGDLAIMLPQVAVYDPYDINIAKGKRTQAATIWQNDRSNGPDVAVNGNLTPHSHNQGEYHDDGSGPDPQYWYVDLGKMTEVKRVVVFMRTDCCQHRQIGMPVQLRDASHNIICQKYTGEGQYPNLPEQTMTVTFTAKDLKPAFALNNIVPGLTVSLLSAISWDRVVVNQGHAANVVGPDLGTNNGYSPQFSRAASFRLVPALNGRIGYVSFENIQNPNFFLRHSGFRVWVHWPEGNEVYRDDVSFKPMPAVNGDPTMVSFQSSNFPEFYLSANRDNPYELWITKFNGMKGSWASQHHSWRIIPALAS
jgi:hypothetical protein